MSHPNKAKGTRWESAVVDYLQAQGWPTVERRSLHGNADKGDIINVDGFVLECKNEKSIALAGYMDEVEAERTNADALYGAAIVKRRNHGTGHAYVVMPLHQFVNILENLRELRFHQEEAA